MVVVTCHARASWWVVWMQIVGLLVQLAALDGDGAILD